MLIGVTDDDVVDVIVVDVVVAATDDDATVVAADAAAGAGNTDENADTAAMLAIVCRLVFSLRQCFSYRMPNSTIKYSISARNTNNMQDISHTYIHTHCTIYK